jgi:hypothetical protein
MKTNITKLAKAIAAVSEDCSRNKYDYDKLEHCMQIRFICEAERFMKAVEYLKENEK